MVWGIAGWVEWIRADLRVGVVETRMGWGVFAGWLGLIAGLVWLRLRFCREGKCAGRYIHYHNNVGGRGGEFTGVYVENQDIHVQYDVGEK